MNDKELLMMAAKAADLNVKAISVNQDDNFDGLIVGKKDTKNKTRWNPLTDDGDALRLAVKLKMDVCVHHTSGFVDVYAYREAELICETEYCENDSFAATRRAIVRSAAEIGSKL